jgi:oligopeptide/dipeptide ABC transporter ATP-binding protein
LRHPVLHRLDVRFSAGRWTCVVGPNGAGKSTLLKVLAGLLPYQGEVFLHGHDLSRLAARERARSMSWLGQATADTAADDLTVYDVALLGRLPHLEWLAEPGDADHAAVARALQQTQAWEWRGRSLGALSGGERQRVMIAIALANNPKLLIADEPTTALDVTVQAQVLDTLRDIVAVRNLGALVITHDLGVVAHYCQRVAVMFAGQIIEDGPVKQVFGRPSHPYTQALIASTPGRIAQLGWTLTGGTPPDLYDLPQGCLYRDRCPRAAPACLVAPPRIAVSDDHGAACHFARDAA